MRVQYKNFGKSGGYCGIITGHSNNTLKIVLDNGDGKECLDLYWNWNALDQEAIDYIAEVERTAIPMTTTHYD